MKRILALVIVMVLVISLAGCGGGVDFKSVVDSSTAPECCEVASDSSYIKVDTNPYDIDNYYKAEYTQTVKDINMALGFSDALWEKMSQTRAMDGRQTDENDSFKVSWSYHPDNGMSVLYERKK